MAPEVWSAKQPVNNVVEYDLLFDCVHCGLCLEACPTYAVTRAEMDSPRGRIYLMKALAEGGATLDADAVHHLDLCLGCRGCETACPSGVHYGRLIEGARDYVESHYSRTFSERVRRSLVGAIFPYPARLRAMLAPVRLLDRLGLRPIVSAALPRMMREWFDLLPPLDGADRDVAASQAAAAPDAPSVIVHRGCVAQVLANGENLAAELLLASAGYQLMHMEQTVCCGALDLHSGNCARALEFARANVRSILASGADAVVSTASGCSAALAEYKILLRDDPQLAEDAGKVSAKVRDLSTLLLDHGMPRMRTLDCTVTYHDACHLAHGMGIRDSPRKALAAVPGVKLVELVESDLCCGSAGSYNLTQPEMARELVRRKADNIVATGADYVVMSNPGCEFQIAAELRRRGSRIKVVLLAEFLASALAD